MHVSVLPVPARPFFCAQQCQSPVPATEQARPQGLNCHLPRRLQQVAIPSLPCTPAPLCLEWWPAASGPARFYLLASGCVYQSGPVLSAGGGAQSPWSHTPVSGRGFSLHCAHPSSSVFPLFLLSLLLLPPSPPQSFCRALGNCHHACLSSPQWQLGGPQTCAPTNLPFSQSRKIPSLGRAS